MNSELIASLLSRTIAYHPVFRDVAGSTVGAVFLSQAYYWSTGQRIPSERAGWFYKTGKQWQEETRLSRSEQIRARRDLKKAGLLEEKRRGRPGRLFYRLNIKRLFELISLLTKSRSGGSSSGEGHGSKGAASAGDPSGQVQADGVKAGCVQSGQVQTEPSQGQYVQDTQTRAENPLYSASLQDSALSDYAAKNPFKNSSMQDSAVLANGAYCLNYPHNDSSKKASEINSMQNAALLSSWDQHLNTGPFTASKKNAFNNSSLQDSGVSDQVSALTVQDSAIKAQNPDIKSAESCDLYTEITTENTSQITAAAVPAVGYEAHDYHEAVLTPAAAHSTQPSEEVIQGGSIQSGQQAWSGSNPGQSSDRQANEHLINDQSDQSIPHDQSQQSTPNPQGPFQQQAEINPQDRVHQQTQGTSLARFPMQEGWQPDTQRLKALCRMRGVSLKHLSPALYQDLLREFRTYRASEGLSMSQHKWELKLVDQLMWNQRNRPELFAEPGDPSRSAGPSINRESRYAKPSSGVCGRSKPKNAAERLAASCAGAFDYFQSKASRQTEYRTDDLPTAQRADGGSGQCSGAVQPATGTVQSAAGHETSGRQDAGHGIGQPVVAGEVSGGAGAEYSDAIATSPASSVSESGWEYDRQHSAESEHADSACQSGDIWSNPNLWPVSWG